MRKPLLFTILVLTLIVNSCSLSKNWIYLQDMVPGEQYPIDIRYEAKIMRDDRLRITVASKNPELALPFNIHSGSFRVGEDGSIAAYQNDVSRQEDGYRVDVDGNIDFPILGKLHVAGLTVSEAIELIKSGIEEGNYMKDPLVSIEFLNFKYTVLGAVGRNGTFSVNGDRITLVEAIAQAGDVTSKGRIDRVAVIRETEHGREMFMHDLRSKDIFESPCYYLQQNDIVYVEPKYRKKDAEDRSWQITTTLLSLTSVICTLIWALK